MTSLVIGNTSQLAYYFPDDYEKISSRSIALNQPLPLRHDVYDRVYLCFAEQRTFLEDSTPDLFFDINVQATIKLIKFFAPKCHKIVVYGTSELWNNCDGPITIKDKPNYNVTAYIRSKHIMTQYVEQLREEGITNTVIIHPFNFNSIYRKPGFLFGKIFDSIINKKKIEIGDTYFYRDLVHPKYVVEKSILAEEDQIVGSGRLTFVNDFIRELYIKSGLNYDEYVTENFDHNLSNKRKIYYLHTRERYDDLLKDTLNDFRI